MIARTFWHRFYASPVPPLHSKYLTYRQTTTGIEGQVPPGATKWWVRQILFRCFQRYPDHVLATTIKGGRLNCNFHTRIKRESLCSGLPWQRRNATCSWHVAHTVVYPYSWGNCAHTMLASHVHALGVAGSWLPCTSCGPFFLS